MLKNYIKIALRNFVKHKAFTFINLTGLTLGLTCTILIGLYVLDEWSFDRFHANSDRIFRVISHSKLGGFDNHNEWTPYIFAEAVQEGLPEVELTTRIRPPSRVLVSNNEISSFEDRFIYADANFLKIFDFEVIRGNPGEALQEPGTIVITQSMARKYFRGSDPIGKELSVSGNSGEVHYRVTAVLEDIPSNSHLTFDFAASMETRIQRGSISTNSWVSSEVVTYLMLGQARQITAVNEKLPDFVKAASNDPDIWYSNYLQPLTDIRLNKAGLPIGGQTDLLYVHVFIAAALIIFLLAVINYANLMTARSIARAKEIGVRKTVGGSRWQLIKQFLAESMLYSLLAVIASVILVEWLVSGFSGIIGKELTFSLSENPTAGLYFLIIAICTGLVSGSYPAFVMSGFKPVTVLKGKFSGSGDEKGISVFRKVLVSGQFTAASVLIIAALVIYGQLNYIIQKNLGFDQEHVLYVDLNRDAKKFYSTIQNSFAGIPGVLSVSVSSSIPGRDFSGNGVATVESSKSEIIQVLGTDDKFLETLNLELVKGRWFSPEYSTDIEHGFVINQAFAKKYNWDNPINKRLQRNEQSGRVIGVIEDFHFESLHKPVEPLLIRHHAEEIFQINQVNVRIAGTNISATIQRLENTWEELLPGIPFHYRFLDDTIQSLYQAEQQAASLITFFGVIAVIVACLGLFGLAGFLLARRTKEIGIRKVFGATVAQLVLLVNKDLLKLVAVSLAIAIPVTWFMAEKWLRSFAYRIDLGVQIFVIAGLIVFAMGIITVSWQSVKAALMNPVDSLRSE